MTTLTITMEHDVGAKALVRAALDNEIWLLETAIRRTKSRIRSFEERFKTSTVDFLLGGSSNTLPQLARRRE